MWGLDVIRHINRKAASRAQTQELVPFRVVSESQIHSWPPFPFPHLGYACEEVDFDHKRLETVFVDSSRFGAEGEPALTVDAFKARLCSLLREHGPLLCAVEEQGQFQVYIAVWRSGGL
jgi:hypothetical protein